METSSQSAEAGGKARSRAEGGKTGGSKTGRGVLMRERRRSENFPI